MSALKGTANFRRFFVDTGARDDVDASRFVRAISYRRFREVGPSESVAFGWCPMTDPLADNIEHADVCVGELVCIGFRLDERAVKAADVRDELKKRAKEIAADRGRPLSRAERQALKEVVIAELRANAPIRRRVAEVVWNFRRKEVRVFGASKSMAQVIAELFEKTFLLEMQPADATAVMERLGHAAVRVVDGKDVRVSSPELGGDLLTLLWHAGENGEDFGTEKAPSPIQLGRHLVMQATDGSGPKVTIRGEYASDSEELHAALARGAAMVSGKAIVGLSNALVSGTISAETLSITGCKLPKQPLAEEVDGEDAPPPDAESRAAVEAEGALLYRMTLLDDAQDAVDRALKAVAVDVESRKAGLRDWINAIQQERTQKAA